MRRFTQEQLMVPVQALAKASDLAPSLIAFTEDDKGTIHGWLMGELVASGTLAAVIVAVSVAASDHRRAMAA